LAETELAGQERPEPAAVPPGGTILVLNGFYEGLELPIDRGRVVVGRGRGADVILAEPTISRAHAAIACDGECFFVEDLGSTNGTLVNGERCERTQLGSGDEIRMGRLQLRVKLPV
jgi:pSer/pThr/pTyr-binding forkhead associated (FHA) protein